MAIDQFLDKSIDWVNDDKHIERLIISLIIMIVVGMGITFWVLNFLGLGNMAGAP